MIRGEVDIDLRLRTGQEVTEGWDRRRLWVLHNCPDGVRVLVLLGNRTWLMDDSYQMLHQHGERLEITLRGDDPDAIAGLVHRARAGSSDVAA